MPDRKYACQFVPFHKAWLQSAALSAFVDADAALFVTVAACVEVGRRNRRQETGGRSQETEDGRNERPFTTETQSTQSRCREQEAEHKRRKIEDGRNERPFTTETQRTQSRYREQEAEDKGLRAPWSLIIGVFITLGGREFKKERINSQRSTRNKQWREDDDRKRRINHRDTEDTERGSGEGGKGKAERGEREVKD
jgi:hypothetical protein